MECVTAQSRMLEADVEELHGDASTDLGRHLASCDRCRAAASRIVEGERDMAAALGAIEPPRAYSSTASPPKADTRRVQWLRWVPALPVAAAIAGLIIVGSGDDTPDLHAPRTQLSRGSPTVRLDQQNGNMVMLKTDNPKITVLWFY